MSKPIKLALAVAAIATLAPVAGSAATLNYRAVLGELNSSGVSGVVRFALDTVGRTLAVSARVAGLKPDALHLQHVHGRFDADGNPVDSVTPPPTADTDGDGFVEVAEGAPFYGDILLPLEDQTDGLNNGPFADAGGNLSFDMSYSLDDDSLFLNPLSGTQYMGDDILPLGLREYVIHGLDVPAGVDGPDATYLASLPVAAAEISPVPLPAGGLLLLTGVAAFAAARRRRAA